MKLFFTQCILWTIPLVAGAQTSGPVSGIKGLFTKVLIIINQITSVLFGLAILFFIWNLVVYLASSTKSEKRSEAARYMLWGIISIFVMVGLYGFINLFLQTTGFKARFFLPAFKY